jgi:putative endonuclease
VERRRALGRDGEQQAARWYEAAGYTVLARNWRCRAGELDLVVERDGTIVFCEVKARSGERFGHPAEAVTARKQARLRRLAALWLAERAGRDSVGRDRVGRDGWGSRRRGRAEIRFDVATVLAGRLEVIEAAF